MKQVPLANEATSHEDSLSKEEQINTRKRRPLKSGMDWKDATMVVNHITWPHEVMYSSAGKPAAYEGFIVSAFVRGYLIIVQS